MAVRPTNLNVHMITSSLLRNDQMSRQGRQVPADSMARPSERELKSMSQSCFPVITMGVPAAYGMKYAKGGLRRIFTENGCETAEMRKTWRRSRTPIVQTSQAGVEEWREGLPLHEETLRLRNTQIDS